MIQAVAQRTADGLSTALEHQAFSETEHRFCHPAFFREKRSLPAWWVRRETKGVYIIDRPRFAAVVLGVALSAQGASAQDPILGTMKFLYEDAKLSAIGAAEKADVTIYSFKPADETRTLAQQVALYHTAQHYGSIATYLRPNGSVPPSTDRLPRKRATTNKFGKLMSFSLAGEMPSERFLASRLQCYMVFTKTVSKRADLEGGPVSKRER